MASNVSVEHRELLNEQGSDGPPRRDRAELSRTVLIPFFYVLTIEFTDMIYGRKGDLDMAVVWSPVYLICFVIDAALLGWGIWRDRALGRSAGWAIAIVMVGFISMVIIGLLYILNH